MKRFFERREEWHVCWTANLSGNRTAIGDGSYTIKPRLNSDMIVKLRAELASDLDIEPDKVNITSLAKISR